MSNLTADLWQDFEFDVLDGASLDAHDHYGPSAWSVNNTHGSMDVAGQMQVQGAINSLTDSGTRGFGIDCNFVGGRTTANFAMLSGPGVKTHLSVGFYLKMPAGWNDSFREQDVIRLENLTGVRQIYVKAADGQFGDGVTRFHLHNETDGYSPGVQVTAGEKYWIVVEYDSTNIIARMRVYDQNNAQVGVEQTRVTSSSGVSGIIIGPLIGSTGAFVGKMFIDNFLVDWTDATYPLGPGEPEPLGLPYLIATPGDVNANSYATLEEANTYFRHRLPLPTLWLETNDPDGSPSERALVMATRLINIWASGAKRTFRENGVSYRSVGRTWTGEIASSTQALAVPRIGLVDRYGRTLASNVIPTELKEATAELAGQLLISDRSLDNDVAIQGITSVSAGSVSVSFKDMIERRVLPDTVVDLMPPSWFNDEYVEPVQRAEFDII